MRYDDRNEQRWQAWDWGNEADRLAAEIQAMEASGDYPHHPMSYTLWDLMTECGVLPYAGGYLDQPAWFDKDVTYLNKRQRLLDLELKLEQYDAPDVHDDLYPGNGKR